MIKRIMRYIGTNNANNAAKTDRIAANENGSVLERLEQLQEAVNKGTGSALGSNRSLVDEMLGASLNYNRTNYGSFSASFSTTAHKTTGNHKIADVTGLCRIRILPVCTANVTVNGTSGTISLGTADDVDVLIAATTATVIDAGELWCSKTDATIDKQILHSEMIDFISNAQDFGYTVGTSNLTGGAITFHYWWEPLDSTGAVAAAAGGTYGS
jgi:hypothetical protein